MEKGKLIVIEGTDCSGKETQTKMLVDRLKNEGVFCDTLSFPQYGTSTGRIVGECYLGKPGMGPSWFKDPSKLDSKIASLYYAADRRALLPRINETLDRGMHLILDRYVSSNMAHQGGKIDNDVEREEFYIGLDELEYGFLELPRPDLTLFLYMPYKMGMGLRGNRDEGADAHEADQNHLRDAERAFLQLEELQFEELDYWMRINCVSKGLDGDIIRTPEDIHGDVFDYVSNLINDS
ncbi:MAG: hypothetical protein IH845_00965 [Nanoarchaeota archaeon]|nr:hypothetical protein [Nanoarchaeota archaeon]